MAEKMEAEEMEEGELKGEGRVKPVKERDKGKKYEIYKVTGEKIKRLRQFCPRCGPGIFMADHEDRLACGKCGYTEYTR